MYFVSAFTGAQSRFTEVVKHLYIFFHMTSLSFPHLFHTFTLSKDDSSCNCCIDYLLNIFRLYHIAFLYVLDYW